MDEKLKEHLQITAEEIVSLNIDLIFARLDCYAWEITAERMAEFICKKCSDDLSFGMFKTECVNCHWDENGKEKKDGTDNIPKESITYILSRFGAPKTNWLRKNKGE